MPTWNLYVLRCGDDTLYTGIATDVDRRLEEHRSSTVGAKYLRGRGPLQIMLQKEVGDRSLASRLEYRFKRLSRAQKLRYCDVPTELDSIIDELASRASAS